MRSTPSAASIVITDETGAQVFEGATPAEVTLDKSDGSYFGKKSYSITIAKDGYKPQTVRVKASPNAWYLVGNVVVGGLIGWLIVDPLSGAMYNLSPDEIDGQMIPDNKHLTRSDTARASGTPLTVVLLEDIPRDLRKKMKKIKG